MARYFLLLFTLTVISTVSSSVYAQNHEGYCDDADSTATSLQCLKGHLDNAQEKLNRVYKNLLNELDGKNQEALKGIQGEWLKYRDAECMWEAEQVEDAPLKRANEISCMARITEDRVNLLTTTYGEAATDNAPREYGSLPRWMNVLAKDYTDTYWNYGGRISADLNCDNEDEYLMQGLKPQLKEPSTVNEGEEVEPKTFTQNFILALVENPVTGRPKPTLFEYVISDSNEEESICSKNVKLKVSIKEDTQEDENTCPTYLELISDDCEAKKISWNGKVFAIEEQSE